MRMLPTTALLAGALVIAGAMRAPEEAHACTCDWPGVQAAVDRVDLVVVARFVSSTGLVEGLGLRETIQVERYLKGSGPEMIDVYDSPSTCGVMLGSSPGERWLVLASLDDSGVPHTGKCHGTTRLDPPDPYTDEVARATFLSEVETVLGAQVPSRAPGRSPMGEEETSRHTPRVCGSSRCWSPPERPAPRASSSLLGGEVPRPKGAA